MTIAHILREYGALALALILAADSAGVPWPTEATLVMVGVAMRAGHVHPAVAVLAALGGAAAGSSLSYYLGRRMGPSLLKRIGKVFHLSEATLNRVEEWFQKHGEKAVFFGRFIPFVRNLSGYPAGVMKMPFGKYMLFTLAGYLGYIAFALSLGYGGLSIARVIGDIEILLWIAGPVALLVLWFKWGRKWNKNRRGKG